MQKLYRDKDWLYVMYWTKGLSTVQIAKKVGTGHTTISKWLHKFNISVRSRGEGCHLAKANHCNLSQKAKEWIDGELLGDGHFALSSPYSAKFRYGSKYLEYINYVSDTLKSFGIEQSGKIGEEYKKKMDCYTTVIVWR